MPIDASAAEQTHSNTARTPLAHEMSAPAANPLARVYRGVWSAVRQLNEDTHLFQVRLDKSASPDSALSFVPGQFAQVYQDADPTGRSRAYSIASVPEQLPELEFCIKLYPDGLLSGYLKTVRAGMPVTLKGPFGRFQLAVEKITAGQGTDVPRIFVVTGTGIAPVRSMLRSLLAAVPSANVTLIQGHRSPSGIFFREEFERLAAEHPSFSYRPLVSRSSTNPAERQYVTDVLREMRFVPETRFYLCGNPAMVREASVQLVERKVPINQIAVEKW